MAVYSRLTGLKEGNSNEILIIVRIYGKLKKLDWNTNTAGAVGREPLFQTEQVYL